MDIGLGLPIDAPGDILAFARRAQDCAAFGAVALVDRTVYDNPEPLITLAAVAGATHRLRLRSQLLVAPVREPVLLAKQAATLDRISGGRFSLGLGVGSRPDDYAAVGADFHDRGRRLESDIALMREVWAGKPVRGQGRVGPAPTQPGGPELLLGGFAPRALDRAARVADGYLSAAPAAPSVRLFDAVRDRWAAAGRSGRPRLVGQVYTGLGGPDVADRARAAVARYYAFSDAADQFVDSVATSPAQVRAAVAGFRDAGADELVLFCWAADLDQLDRLVDSCD